MASDLWSTDMFELHVLPGVCGLPTVDPTCLAAIILCRMTIPHGRWYVVPDGQWETGLLPKLYHNSVAYAGFDAIAEHLKRVSHGIWDLDQHLDAQGRADSRALTSLLKDTLEPLALHALFLSPENYDNVVQPAMSSALRGPHSWFVPSQLRMHAEHCARRQQLPPTSLLQPAHPPLPVAATLESPAGLPTLLARPRAYRRRMLMTERIRHHERVRQLLDQALLPLEELLETQRAMVPEPTPLPRTPSPSPPSSEPDVSSEQDASTSAATRNINGRRLTVLQRATASAQPKPEAPTCSLGDRLRVRDLDPIGTGVFLFSHMRPSTLDCFLLAYLTLIAVPTQHCPRCPPGGSFPDLGDHPLPPCSADCTWHSILPDATVADALLLPGRYASIRRYIREHLGKCVSRVNEAQGIAERLPARHTQRAQMDANAGSNNESASVSLVDSTNDADAEHEDFDERFAESEDEPYDLPVRQPPSRSLIERTLELITLATERGVAHAPV